MIKLEIKTSKNGIWKYVMCPRFSFGEYQLKLIGDKFVCDLCGYEIDKRKVDWYNL